MTKGLVKAEDGRKITITIPIANTTNHPITLHQHTVVGHLQAVKAVYPANLSANSSRTTPSTTSHQETCSAVEVSSVSREQQSGNSTNKGQRPKWHPPVELEHLSETQREAMKQTLYEECEAFSYNEDDIGCIPSLNMHISLSDPTPVQKTYISIPKPLHAEVKEYLQDLLNKGWITPPRSPYSSPVVCVRKKDGSLRLCCDYRELNNQSLPDRHPIPRIQDMLDSLTGSSWFSVLNQGKAYHQGFLDPNSHPLTAFITPWGLYQWVRILFVPAQLGTC